MIKQSDHSIYYCYYDLSIILSLYAVHASHTISIVMILNIYFITFVSTHIYLGADIIISYYTPRILHWIHELK